MCWKNIPPHGFDSKPLRWSDWKSTKRRRSRKVNRMKTSSSWPLDVARNFLFFPFLIACCTWINFTWLKAICKGTQKPFSVTFLKRCWSLETKLNVSLPLSWNLDVVQDLIKRQLFSPLAINFRKYVCTLKFWASFSPRVSRDFLPTRFCCFPLYNWKLFSPISPPQPTKFLFYAKIEEKGKRWKIKFRYLLSNCEL